MVLENLTLRIATVQQILPLRHAVLRPGLPMSTAHFEGDDESDALHVAALDAGQVHSHAKRSDCVGCHGLEAVPAGDAGQVVGCTTLLRRPLDDQPAWQLRGMAVSPQVQGQGVGKAVVRFAIDQASTMPDAPLLFWCNARQIAIPFYERLGWRCISDFFEVPTVGPHRKMRYDHPRVTR